MDRRRIIAGSVASDRKVLFRADSDACAVREKIENGVLRYLEGVIGLEAPRFCFLPNDREEECSKGQTSAMAQSDHLHSVTSISSKLILSLQTVHHHFRTWILVEFLYNHILIPYEDNRVNLRELYYKFKEQFGSYKRLAATVADISFLFRVTREQLRIFPSSRGMIFGQIEIFNRENGLKYDCSMAQEIIKPEMVYGDVEYYSEASFILIVEKETLFAKLVHEGISEKFGCLLLTGQGYPSLLTRQLVFQMDSRFNIPIFGIFDCNPHGIQIFLTYRDGSLRSGLDGVKYVIKKIQWIGIFLKDYEDAGIALEKLEALTPRECAILKSLKGCNRLGNLETEISKMLRLQVKADIEKLDERQASFVSKKLIPSKLCEVQKT